jgi:AAA+ ATPase superfamily predicted ATPase
MKPKTIKLKKNFIGREFEYERLKKIGSSDEANIIIMYGRRRVGKTELLEQTFRDRNILKFEGIESLTEKAQFANAMSQLADYTEEPLLAKTVIESWREFFMILSKYTRNGTWTIYLEELQWLANYKDTLVSELKYVWDNFFRQNPNLILILCGSSPSFMIDHVLHSKALYNRSQDEFHLKEFTLPEMRKFLKNRNEKEVMDAYLTIGGIPEYLKWVSTESSVFLNLCKNSFLSGCFFAQEYERIFTSSLSKNKHYKEIIEILSKRKFATRKELTQALKMSSGGTLSSLLQDLEKSGLITAYHPFNLGEKTLLKRYSIEDNYLQFFFKFIDPLKKNISSGAYLRNPQSALKLDSYVKWLGFSFERFCRKYHYVIARILQFAAVNYQSGAFFNKATDEENPGYQLDLIFDRSDNVCTVCEIKYLNGKVGTNVINEMEKKLSIFPYTSKKTIHKVLICNEGADENLLKRAYFDDVITLPQLIDPRNW